MEKRLIRKQRLKNMHYGMTTVGWQPSIPVSIHSMLAVCSPASSLDFHSEPGLGFLHCVHVSPAVFIFPITIFSLLSNPVLHPFLKSLTS